ncbi:glycosyltransferase [Collinsella tanakaei]|nr:glycosyltransferase [Collinsella tanakaei]
MRVLLVNKFHYRKGGSETYYFALADALRSLGHEVFFFAMEDPRNEPCDQARYFVSAKDYNGPSSIGEKIDAVTSFFYSKEARGKFEALCEDVRPDFVHMNLVHRQITFSILDAPYLREHRVPVVWTAHDYIAVCPNYTMLDGAGSVCDACVGGSGMNCLKRKCVKGSTAKSVLAMLEAKYLSATKAYEKIDRIICPSQFLGSKMVEGGFPERQLVWMPNFLTDEAVAEMDATPMCEAADPYFVYFGRLVREKGVEVLLRAFAQAAPSLSADWRLKVVGDGPMRGELERLAAELAVADRVEFLGYKAGAELRAFVKGARFSVAPSTWHENMPFSVVESLLAGTPVIGSRMGGIPELVTDGRTGFTFASGDVDELAGLLRFAAQLPADDYRQMQSAGRAFVEDRCSQSTYMNKLIELYDTLIQEKKGN